MRYLMVLLLGVILVGCSPNVDCQASSSAGGQGGPAQGTGGIELPTAVSGGGGAGTSSGSAGCKTE